MNIDISNYLYLYIMVKETNKKLPALNDPAISYKMPMFQSSHWWHWVAALHVVICPEQKILYI